MIENTTQAPTAIPPPEVPIGSFPYGWDGVEATRRVDKPTGEFDIHGNKLMEPTVESLPYPQYYLKQFTHEPRTIIIGAPKWGKRWDGVEPKTRRQLIRHNGTKPTRYIVWSDRSLRLVNKVLRKQFLKMTPAQQNEMIEQAAARAEAPQQQEAAA